MFSASHFESVQELIVLQRAEKLMISERQHQQKKKKIYIRIVYGLALHEFSVVQSGWRAPAFFMGGHMYALLRTQILSLFHASDMLIISFLHSFKC